MQLFLASIPSVNGRTAHYILQFNFEVFIFKFVTLEFSLQEFLVRFRHSSVNISNYKTQRRIDEKKQKTDTKRRDSKKCRDCVVYTG